MVDVVVKDATMGMTDFDRISTYSDTIVIFFLVLSGTYFYSFSVENKWIAPLVILIYGILVAACVFSKYRIQLDQGKKEDGVSDLMLKPRGINAALIWMMWLIYGSLFRDFEVFNFEGIEYIHNFIVIITVIYSYTFPIKEPDNNTILFTNMLVFMLFIPNYHSLSFDVDGGALFLKVILFYVLYTLNEVIEILENQSLIQNARKYMAKEDDWIHCLYNFQLQVIQSSWILFASKILLCFIVFQLMPIAIIIIFKSLKFKHKPNDNIEEGHVHLNDKTKELVNDKPDIVKEQSKKQERKKKKKTKVISIKGFNIKTLKSLNTIFNTTQVSVEEGSKNDNQKQQ